MQENLFHISQDRHISVFEPLPAPFYTGIIAHDVVFAISNKMLHNYLLPRNCPRVTFYAGPQTLDTDRHSFLNNTRAKYIVCVESAWISEIQKTTLYSYEFSPESFVLLDEVAGYYISYAAVIPLKTRPIYNMVEEILKRDVELRFMPSIVEIGRAVQQSTLNYSLIRMHYANQKPALVNEGIKKKI